MSISFPSPQDTVRAPEDIGSATVQLAAAQDGAQASGQGRALDGLSAVALLYLALPLLIFLGGWLKLPFAVALVGIAAFGLREALRPALARPWRQGQFPTASVAAILVAAAALWTTFGGVGHFLYANSDWVARDAVLRDLSFSAWPPRYGSNGPFDVILRAPVGYFLPAAVLGSWFGLSLAHKGLWLWTVLGAGLFFMLIPLPKRPGLKLAAVLAAVILFSGMDIVGWLLSGLPAPHLGEHLEWWANAFQYSSQTTQLFWVPNHALPAWIGTALFFRHWRHPDFPRFAPMLFAALPLWSPFPAIGLAPFFLLLAAKACKERGWRAFPLASLLPAVAIIAVLALYLSLDIGLIPAQSAMTSQGHFLPFLAYYLPFIMVECGLLVLALCLLRADRLMLATSLLVLLILPLFQMGPGNDIVMRASIPALAMLCLLAVVQLQRPDFLASPGPAVLLIVVLLIGAVTPLQEWARPLLAPPWPPSRFDLVTMSRGKMPAHYFARLNNPALAGLFKPPANVLMAH